MVQDLDSMRRQMSRRLRSAGFQGLAAGKITGMTDSILQGLAPLPLVLVAAMETCRACGLAKTHRQLADAVACLADEAFQQASIPSGLALPRPQHTGRSRARTP